MRGPSALSPAPGAARSGPPADRLVAGAAYAVAATLFFVCMDTLAKYGGQFLPVPMLIWGRFGFHLLVLLALIPFIGAANVVKTGQAGRHLLRGVCLATATVFAYSSVQYVALVDLYAVAFTVPLMVTVLSIPILGESVGLRRWIAVFVGLIGVLVIIRPGFAEFNIGLVLAVFMALAFAAYQILTRGADQTDGPFVGLFYAAIIGSAGATLVVPFAWQTPDAFGWLLLAALGLFGAAGHFMLIMALRCAPASYISPFTYAQIVWATLVGIVVFNDLPDPFTVLGGAIVIGAGLFVLWRERVLAGKDGS